MNENITLYAGNVKGKAYTLIYFSYMDLVITLALLVAGLAILIAGAEALVRGASSLGRSVGITPLVIGLTIVAFGTSAPELTVNIYSAIKGSTDLALGNIIGSNIANILLILGVTACLTPLVVKSSTVRWEIPLALLAMLLVFVFGSDILFDGGAQNIMTRSDGIALLGFFIIFMFYVFALVSNESASQDEGTETEGKPLGFWSATGLSLVGLIGLVLGGKMLVDQAVVLATLAGLSEAVIGLTVVAIGTSLPELATSIVAALKKEVDIAVGNIVGSNIFNVFWILGVTSVIAPLPSPDGFMVDASVAILATLALFLALFVGNKHQLDRWQGVVFVLAYIGYLTYLVI